MKKYFVGIYGVGKEHELDQNKFWFNSYELALKASEVLNNLSRNNSYEVTRPINLMADTYKLEIFDSVPEQIGFRKDYSKKALTEKGFFAKEKVKERVDLEKFKKFTHIVIPTHYKVTSYTEHSKITVGRYFDEQVAMDNAEKINNACNYESAKIEKIQKMRLTVFDSIRSWEAAVKEDAQALSELALN